MEFGSHLEGKREILKVLKNDVIQFNQTSVLLRLLIKAIGIHVVQQS